MEGAKLARMADQIARNFAAQGEQAAVEQTAEHIRLFWDPRMKAALRDVDSALLSPVVARALARI